MLVVRVVVQSRPAVLCAVSGGAAVRACLIGILKHKVMDQCRYEAREGPLEPTDYMDVYALNEGYEMVEGEWIFQLYFGDRLLTEQRFITFHPEAQAVEKSSRLENPDATSSN